MAYVLVLHGVGKKRPCVVGKCHVRREAQHEADPAATILDPTAYATEYSAHGEEEGGAAGLRHSKGVGARLTVAHAEGGEMVGGGGRG